MRKATHAFWIPALVSSSVPPVLLILLPSYVKQSVSSSGFPSTVTTFLLFVLAFIILFLFILTISPRFTVTARIHISPAETMRRVLQFLDLFRTASTSSVIISSFVLAAIVPCDWFSSSSFPSVGILSSVVLCPSSFDVLLECQYVITFLCLYHMRYLCFPFSI